jgi:hypothetical protein
MILPERVSAGQTLPTAPGLVAFVFAGVDLARSAATAGSVSTSAQPKAKVNIASFIISSSNLFIGRCSGERNILSML